MALAIARLRLAALAARPPRSRLRAYGPWAVSIIVAAATVALVAAGIITDMALPATALTVGACWLGLVGTTDGALEPRAFRGAVRWHGVALGTTLGALVSPVTVLAIGIGIAAGMFAQNVGGGLLAASMLAVTCALARLVSDPGSARDDRPWLGAFGAIALTLAAASPFALGLDAGLEVLRGSPFAASVGWLSGAPFAMAVATIAVLALMWTVVVFARMRTPDRRRTPKRLGAFALANGAPWTAVSARTLTMWGRDRRYQVTGVAVVLVPLLVGVPLWLAGVPAVFWTLLPVAVLALFLGWASHNDLAYDGTAYWAHVAARVPGWQDRLGRLLPVAIAAVPILLIAALVATQLWGDDRMLAPLIGAGAALTGVGIGVSAVVGARWPYPVAGPDESPFVSPASQPAGAALTQAIALLMTAALAAPVVVPVAMELADPRSMWLPIGVGTAVVAMVLGILIGGAVIDRRSPELLAAAMRH